MTFRSKVQPDILQITSKETLDACTMLFIKVFNDSPWNDEWTMATARPLLNCYFNTPQFIGLMAVANKTPLGCIMGNIEPNFAGDIFYLRELFVAPDHKNKGIGKYLMAALKKELSLKNAATLVLFTRNTIFSYYQQFGFVNQHEMGLMTCSTQDLVLL